MRSALELSPLQPERMSFLQLSLIEQVLQPPDQADGHPSFLLQSDVFPVLGQKIDAVSSYAEQRTRVTCLNLLAVLLLIQFILMAALLPEQTAA